MRSRGKRGKRSRRSQAALVCFAFRPPAGSRNDITSTASMIRAEASTSSPAEHEPLTWRSHPMTLGPTNPPRLPIDDEGNASRSRRAAEKDRWDSPKDALHRALTELGESKREHDDRHAAPGDRGQHQSSRTRERTCRDVTLPFTRPIRMPADQHHADERDQEWHRRQLGASREIPTRRAGCAAATEKCHT